MAGAFFAELGLPRPDHALGVGGGGHAEQTGPDADRPRADPARRAARTRSSSTATPTRPSPARWRRAKLGIPVAHVEAGLRSFDRRMPEEINRVVADHLVDAGCFAPTPDRGGEPGRGGHHGRRRPGRRPDAGPGRPRRGRGRGTPAALATRRGARLGVAARPGGYLFATIHRAENRDPGALRAWAGLLGRRGRGARPVILALHPGTRAALDAGGHRPRPAVRVVAPLGYRTTLTLQLHAAAVLTDSGGVQREAAWLRTPCLVLRDRTEWVEAVAGVGRADGRGRPGPRARRRRAGAGLPRRPRPRRWPLVVPPPWTWRRRVPRRDQRGCSSMVA